MTKDFIDRMIKENQGKIVQWNKDNPPVFTRKVIESGMEIIYGFWKFENGDVGFIRKYLKDKPFDYHGMIVLPAGIIGVIAQTAKYDISGIQ